MPTATPACVPTGTTLVVGTVRVTVLATGRGWCVLRIEHGACVTVRRVPAEPKRRIA